MQKCICGKTPVTFKAKALVECRSKGLRIRNTRATHQMSKEVVFTIGGTHKMEFLESFKEKAQFRVDDGDPSKYYT